MPRTPEDITTAWADEYELALQATGGARALIDDEALVEESRAQLEPGAEERLAWEESISKGNMWNCFHRAEDTRARAVRAAACVC